MDEMEYGRTPGDAPASRHSGKRNVWGGIVAAATMIGVFACVAVSGYTLTTLKSYITNQEEEADTETKEDYVTIAEHYEIKPTTAISDAYHTGDVSELDDKQKETLDMAKAALEAMKIKDSMTDFEKEKTVYEWMTTSLQQDRGALTVIPKTQEDCDNPYGVLKYHNAVCVGYATTFRMFMQMLDIECMVVHNQERWHSWDIVKLEDGWYMTDVYSDAGNANYAHFNMTDDMLGQQQNWDRDFFPAATSLKYNMAYQNRVKIADIYDIPGALRKAMDDQLGSIMIAFSRKITEEDAPIASAIATAVDNMLMSGSYPGLPYSLNNYNWVQDPEDGSYLFCVYMSPYNNDMGAGSLTEEQQNMVQERVDEAFHDLTNPEWTDDGAMPDGGYDPAGDVPAG